MRYAPLLGINTKTVQRRVRYMNIQIYYVDCHPPLTPLMTANAFVGSVLIQNVDAYVKEMIKKRGATLLSGSNKESHLPSLPNPPLPPPPFISFLLRFP